MDTTKILEVGKTYTTKEIQDFLGVSKSTWNHKRNELLNNFSLYYEYEVIYEGSRTNYKIIRQLGDYQKPPSKKSKALRDHVYSEEIINVVLSDNLQTAANIARIITPKQSIQQFNHSDGTAYEYTRLNVRELFGNVDSHGKIGQTMDKIWCRIDYEHNMYIPIPDEDILDFRYIFEQLRATTHAEEFEILSNLLNSSDLPSNLQEAYEDRLKDISFQTYYAARTRFKEKHGYTPIKIPLYGIFGVHCRPFDYDYQKEIQKYEALQNIIR